jgi:hypothetical protein
MSDPVQHYVRNIFDFVVAEVGVAHTLANLAIEAEVGSTKRRRNQRNARRGYESALEFLAKARAETGLDLTAEQMQRFHGVRDLLAKLGETDLRRV